MTISTRSLWAILVIASAAAAPAQSLTTTFAAGNGQAGNMFDLVAINQVAVDSFDLHLQPGTWDIEIYAVAAGGTHIGLEQSTSAWVLLARVPGVVSAGNGVGTALGLNLGFGIPAGATQGFYITVANGSSIIYTNLGTQGGVLVQDANLQFLTGSGNVYPFGSFFQPRAWNGTVHYSLGTGRPGPYQTNQPGASFDIDGQTSAGYGAARSQRCGGETATMTSSTTATGQPFDLLFTATTLRPRLLQTAGLQRLNADITDPSFFFLTTGLNYGGFAWPHPGSFSLPVQTPVGALTFGLQMVVLDPAQMDGFSLSQGAELSLLAQSNLIGPSGDDTSTAIAFVGAPLCGVQDLAFYGSIWTQMHISSNGRILFGGADTDFSPSVAEALTDTPMVGAWTDYNPGAVPSGAIMVSINPAGEVQVDFGTPTNPIPYWGQSPLNSFQVRFQPTTGEVTLSGLLGLTPGTSSMFLGMSGGSFVGATDPGAANFAGGSGGTMDGTAMLYEFGTEGSLAAGMDTILFVPNGFLNYDWVAF